jgi:hypothetical protein
LLAYFLADHENGLFRQSEMIFYKIEYIFSLPDGLFRRGDVNVLLVGDPGTAKSQLLKFAEKVSPVGVSFTMLILSLLIK